MGHDTKSNNHVPSGTRHHPIISNDSILYTSRWLETHRIPMGGGVMSLQLETHNDRYFHEWFLWILKIDWIGFAMFFFHGQADEFMCCLPPTKVPKRGTSGERWRERQLAIQLPRQDLALAYCRYVEPCNHRSYQDFIAARNDIALDIAYVKEITGPMVGPPVLAPLFVLDAVQDISPSKPNPMLPPPLIYVPQCGASVGFRMSAGGRPMGSLGHQSERRLSSRKAAGHLARPTVSRFNNELAPGLID